MSKQAISILILTLFLASGQLMAQENVLLSRSYWKDRPGLDQVRADIEKGNDPAELDGNAFDATTWALIEKADNEVVKHLLKQPGNEVNKADA